MNEPNQAACTLRPTIGSYLAFCGIWIVLAISYAGLALRHPGAGFGKGAALAGSVAMAAVLWMSGHRIIVVAGGLHYRDGFFRSRSIPLADITSVLSTWEQMSILGREIRIPRLSVKAVRPDQGFLINPKPFSRRSLRELQDLVRKQPPPANPSQEP